MPDIVIKIIVCLIASFLAGIGTGFVGMSAAVAITPFLMGFLNVSHFDATAIALASDVLASAIAAITYGRHKNIDIKNGLILMFTVLVFTIGGTIAGYYIPSNLMGMGTIVSVLLMGIKLVFFPRNKSSKSNNELSKRHKICYSLLFGALIGFVCGFVGAGGGMMLLLVLTVFLGYEMHIAVGTSVFTMTFSALVGSAFHIVYEGYIAPTPETNIGNIDFTILGLCVIFTLLFSFIGSKLANKMSEKSLSLISGIMLVCIAITVSLVREINVITKFDIFAIIAVNIDIVGLLLLWFFKVRKHKYEK